jgi:ribose transport system substrate-binding protein
MRFRGTGLFGFMLLIVVAAVFTSIAMAGRTSKAADIAYAKAQIAKYTGLPKFISPGPKIDLSKVRGKTVFNIPDSSANPFANNIALAEAQAAKLVGLDYIDYHDQGLTTQWVAGMYQAISRKADLINVFGGVDPRVIHPQITAAKKAGIRVIGTHIYDKSQHPLYVETNVVAPYVAAARLEADWVILDTKANADVLVVTSNEVVPTKAIVAALKSEFAQHCGSACKLSFFNAPVSDWATKIQSNVQSALLRDPKINYIIPIYDSMSQFVVPAITAANKIGKVHISTYNGTPFVLGYMQKGDIVRMDVGENLNWLGWAYIDADMRILSGQKLPLQFDEHTPLRVFTKANVAQAGTPPQLSTGYGTAYQIGYKKLWGIH